ncbi:RNA polymerase sigma factor SigB [Bacillus sp. REN16]|uniref:RNA polymerase sigma factor SigB n=1 Tax=Bacillus sp. REN16 TaxID=2887296 RepID=UPI001E56BDDB|nr:RNA polymerase sigma factor SigB [Bacillus sp. REN16]MCC3358068.1 RNA polymerase sigma factor SigB [Bacillus sp. REN16]
MRKQSTNPKHEEVERLVQNFQKTGSKQTEREIVERYEKIIQSIAWKYSRGRAFHEDIVQVGRIGLLGAIRRFDETLGKSFHTFAIPTIIGEIKHFLRDKTWSVHVPRRAKELGTKIMKAEEELTTILQRKPEVHEIANHLHVDVKEVLEAMELGQAYRTQSIDMPIDPDSEGRTIMESVGKKEKGYEKALKKLDVKNALHVLTTSERRILYYTYIKEKSQRETGKIVGVSQMHVSRIQRNAIKKLRQAVLG